MDEMEILKNRLRILEHIVLELIHSDRIVLNKTLQFQDGRNIQLAKGTGTKIGTGTDQKLAFFNTTPIVQQTTTSQSPASFTPNTSNIDNDSATWAGYTIGDVVAILRAYGLLA